MRSPAGGSSSPKIANTPAATPITAPLDERGDLLRDLGLGELDLLADEQLRALADLLDRLRDVRVGVARLGGPRLLGADGHRLVASQALEDERGQRSRRRTRRRRGSRGGRTGCRAAARRRSARAARPRWWLGPAACGRRGRARRWSDGAGLRSLRRILPERAAPDHRGGPGGQDRGERAEAGEQRRPHQALDDARCPSAAGSYSAQWPERPRGPPQIVSTTNALACSNSSSATGQHVEDPAGQDLLDRAVERHRGERAASPCP